MKQFLSYLTVLFVISVQACAQADYVQVDKDPLVAEPATEEGVSQDDEKGTCVCDEVEEDVFCDDFCGEEVDLDKWWYGRTQWGNGKEYKNNGVIPENVEQKDGLVYFWSNGDNYSGDLKGMRKDNPDLYQDAPGTRAGGVLVSDDYMGSGKYEFRMKLPKETGVCTALWTFHYQEVYQDDPSYEEYIDLGYAPQGNDNDGYYVTPNHEIDIEFPTAPKGGDEYEDVSYEYARLNTWIGELNYTDDFHHMGKNLSDGKFHVYRWDWHTGGNDEEPRVEFYVDDSLVYTSTKHIPFIKGRLWIGTWFPQWAGGAADFDRTALIMDWVKFTPFNEPNDKKVRESFKNSGLTKCKYKKDNDKFLRKCRLATF